MKVSVIIPVYNCEKFISTCIDSVLNQTWKEYEIIIINDGSTDLTGKICDEYARQNSKINVIHQKNHGVSYARNIGLMHATGEFVSFIDGDDTLDAEMYEVLIEIIQKYNVDISHCGYKRIVGREIRYVHDTGHVLVQERQEALRCLITGHVFGGGLWNKLFRRELLEGLSFRENLKINEDILFNYEAFSKAEKSVFIDRTMYNYIWRPGISAVSRTSYEKKIKDACEVARIIYDGLKNGELKNVAIERYIRSLSNFYRYCLDYDKKKCESISADIQRLADEADKLGKRMFITVKLIRYCPKLYYVVKDLYARIRKPQWEARKD